MGNCTRKPSLIFLAGLAAAVGLGAAAGGGSAPAELPFDSLRVEVTLDRTIFSPTDPVVARFTLINADGQPIEVPIESTICAETVNLPDAILYGPPGRPALTISIDGDPPLAIPRPGGSESVSESDAEAASGSKLVLGPRTVLGAQIDLRSTQRSLRYAGQYRVEWRPFGADGPRASASFRIEPRKSAIIVTDFGKINVELAYDTAPRNVENFLDLARTRFYDGLTMHRIIPNFIMQGGSPDGTSGGIRPDGRLVAAEISGAPFVAGTVAMARRPSDPDSASCQFFISLERVPELDGEYTIIGHASDEESLQTIQQIAALPTDADGRPQRPVVIRFVTLVDAHQPGVQRFDSVRP